MHAKFLVRGELEESTIRKILDPIILGINRTLNKVIYHTRIGIVEYVTLPSESNPEKNKVASVSSSPKKIFLWNRKGTEELEAMLKAKGVEIVKIGKEGIGKSELKK